MSIAKRVAQKLGGPTPGPVPDNSGRMKISDLIAQLESIKAENGDLLVGSGDDSPNEGLCYAISSVTLRDANGKTKCVDISHGGDYDALDDDALDDEIMEDEDER